MEKPLNLDDACDLDSGKICDNCCMCIEQNGEFITAFAQFNLPVDEFVLADSDAEEDDEYGGEDGELWEMDIDPELLAEWEARLAYIEGENHSAEAFKRFRGVRKKV